MCCSLLVLLNSQSRQKRQIKYFRSVVPSPFSLFLFLLRGFPSTWFNLYLLKAPFKRPESCLMNRITNMTQRQIERDGLEGLYLPPPSLLHLWVLLLHVHQKKILPSENCILLLNWLIVIVICGEGGEGWGWGWLGSNSELPTPSEITLIKNSENHHRQ